MFTLTKWYLDGVDEAGRVMVAYWTRLALGELVLGWSALSEYVPGASESHGWSVSPCPPPARSGDLIRWQADALDVSITMEAHDAPHELRLFECDEGAVTWRGETMAADVRAARSAHPSFTGTGYAECLTLTIAPWRLPIAQLEWGRWIADDRRHASTWFRWRGEHALQRVVEDGRDAQRALIDGASVTTATSTLGITMVRRLERRGLREIVAGVPMIDRFLPASLLALEETQWLGRGTRRDADGAVHEGWAIHESVRLR